MAEITINHLKKSYGAHQVFTDLNLEVNKKDRVGLVGRNGSGKTTIFRLIAGLENYQFGKISLTRNKTIGYLEQNPVYHSKKPVIEILKQGLADILKLKNKLEDISHKMQNEEGKKLEQLMRQYNSLQTEFEMKDGYNLKVKLQKVCEGLKIPSQMQEKNFETLSGGEKTRVLLAKMLLKNPDILLMDEPTNHLDVDSIEWLEEFLLNYQGTILAISHDRYFLDRIAKDIIELENGKAKLYPGNYSKYRKLKEKEIELQFKRWKDQQKKIKKMKEAIKRYRDWGERADNPAMFKKAFNIEKKLERMEKIEKPQEKKQIGLDFRKKNRSGQDVLKLQNVDKSFDNQNIISNLNFELFYKEKVALLGKNGSGKTTILKLINQELEPDAGTIKIGARVKIGYLEQEVSFSDESLSVLEHYRIVFPVSETKARNDLAAFLFFGNEVFKKIAVLSGGEKVRFKLCILMHKNINLLLLDEPTNHLDVDAIEALEDSLKNFEGTIFFISHDRYFINKIAQKIAALENKKLKIYLGGYDFYKQKKGNINREEKESSSEKFISKGKEEFLKSRKEANKRKKWQRRLKTIKSEVDTIETQINDKEKLMEKHGRDYEKLQKLQNEIDNLNQQLNELLHEWEDLESKL